MSTGSTVRLVRDDAPLIRLTECFQPTTVPRRPCILRRGHEGPHLPQPSPWPRKGAA